MSSGESRTANGISNSNGHHIQSQQSQLQHQVELEDLVAMANREIKKKTALIRDLQKKASILEGADMSKMNRRELEEAAHLCETRRKELEIYLSRLGK